MADLETIAQNLSSLTVIEAAELVKMLENKWGVSAAAPGFSRSWWDSRISTPIAGW